MNEPYDPMTSRDMDDLTPLDQGKRAIAQVLKRIKTHPHFGYFCGFGTETFALLTEAHASLNGLPLGEVRTHFLPRHATDPRKWRLDWRSGEHAGLPDDETTVLFAIEGEPDAHEGYHDGGDWYYANRFLVTGNVCAWAPMPEAPRQEEL